MSVRAFSRLVALPTLLVAGAIAARLSIAGVFGVPSRSMEPALLPGDQLVAARVARGEDLARGDVVVFEGPGDRALVKRVVGLPGDSIVVAGSRVVVNGTTLPEPYALPDRSAAASTHLVPSGHYFVMGDNRAHSEDSRVWGFVAREAIVGRARLVFWSRDSRGAVRWARIGTPVE
jgi:signal peptidase I